MSQVSRCSTMNYDVTILTESRYAEPLDIEKDWYVEQVLTEDRILAEALTNLGLKVQRRDWADPEVDWEETRAAIFRTTWNYFHRFQDFDKWLKEVAKKTLLFNAEQLVRWNMDKHYLQDLQTRGINVISSIFRTKRHQKDLKSWCQELGGEEWILKPTISGAARHTYRIVPTTIKDHESIYAELINQEDLMLQPFQKNVLESGELSLMVMNGQYTHAVRKRAKSGDFRVQDDFGGSVEKHEASPEEIDLALKSVLACDPKPLYARVDIIKDNDSELAISELELIEPELWFRNAPEAAKVLAEGLANSIQ